MKINKNLLVKKLACTNVINWFINKYGDGDIDIEILANDLLKDEKENWLAWLITRNLNKTNLVKYAIFSAELVLHIFEKTYPDDTRPRKAIDVAKEYLENNNIKINYIATAVVAYVAADDAVATNAAGNAAYAAGNAAVAAYAAIAANAADDAVANAAANAADAAANAVAYTNEDADADDASYDFNVSFKKETYKKIIDFGIKLLNEEDK